MGRGIGPLSHWVKGPVPLFQQREEDLYEDNDCIWN